MKSPRFWIFVDCFSRTFRFPSEFFAIELYRPPSSRARPCPSEGFGESFNVRLQADGRRVRRHSHLWSTVYKPEHLTLQSTSLLLRIATTVQSPFVPMFVLSALSVVVSLAAWFTPGAATYQPTCTNYTLLDFKIHALYTDPTLNAYLPADGFPISSVIVDYDGYTTYSILSVCLFFFSRRLAL